MSSFRGAEGDEESLGVLDFVSREIPRFARNDRLKPFFSNLLDEILRGHSAEREDHTPPLRVTLPWEVRRPLSRLNVRLQALQDLGPGITARTHPAVC